MAHSGRNRYSSWSGRNGGGTGCSEAPEGKSVRGVRERYGRQWGQVLRERVCWAEGFALHPEAKEKGSFCPG